MALVQDKVIDLLLPDDGGDFEMAIRIKPGRFIFVHLQRGRIYFVHRCSTDDPPSSLVRSFTAGARRHPAVPQVYYTQPFLNKIRAQLGIEVEGFGLRPPPEVV